MLCAVFGNFASKTSVLPNNEQMFTIQAILLKLSVKEVNKLQQKALKERNSILQYVLLLQLISNQEFDYKLYRNN